MGADYQLGLHPSVLYQDGAVRPESSIKVVEKCKLHLHLIKKK
jgi:hypothetical protein